MFETLIETDVSILNETGISEFAKSLRNELKINLALKVISCFLSESKSKCSNQKLRGGDYFDGLPTSLR